MLRDEFKVIVAGSRDFNDYKLMCDTLDNLLKNKRRTHKIIVICGMAKGADLLGYRYANTRNYSIRCFPAEWETHGKKAGVIRNEEMAKNADALVAFWNGISPGTKNMIETAKNYNLNIRIKKY